MRFNKRKTKNVINVFKNYASNLLLYCVIE